MVYTLCLLSRAIAVAKQAHALPPYDARFPCAGVSKPLRRQHQYHSSSLAVGPHSI